MDEAVFADANWGDVPDADLFSSCAAKATTPSFCALVERLSAEKASSEHDVSRKNPFGQPPKVFELVEYVRVDSSTKDANSIDAKIKEGQTQQSQASEFSLNLKDMAFEVEKFVAASQPTGDARCEANVQLALQLGAKRPKRKGLNYKVLKQQRIDSKTSGQNEIDRESLLRQLARNSKVQKRKVKRKGKKK